MNYTHVCMTAANHPDFSPAFILWLRDNQKVWEAFEAEALKVIARGHQHYSSKTIMEFLRHHSMISESAESPWKLNNNLTPYLSRLFALIHPEFAGLFSYRSVA